MKHIKLFESFGIPYNIYSKESESFNDTISDIKDICLDLQDSGLSITVKGFDRYFNDGGKTSERIYQIARARVYGKNVISVDIVNNNEPGTMVYSDMKETFDRLIYFMTEKKYSYVYVGSYGSIISDRDMSIIKDSDVKCEMFKLIFYQPETKIKKESKLFESESFEDIKDICLELEDEGFRVKMSDYGLGISKIVFNGTYKVGKFKYSDIEEVIERIKSYLGDNFSNIAINFDNHWVHFGQEVIRAHSAAVEPFANPNYTLDRIEGVIIEYKRNINESLNFFNKKLSQEAIDDIKDICLELSDDRFIVADGDLKNGISDGTYEVNITKDNLEPFSYAKVKEVIERLKDYLKNNISVLVMQRGSFKWTNADVLSINNNNKARYISSSIRAVKIIIKP